MHSYLLKGGSNEEFVEKLEKAAKKTLTSKERHEQKISYVFSTMKSEHITKEKIRQILESQES